MSRRRKHVEPILITVGFSIIFLGSSRRRSCLRENPNVLFVSNLSFQNSKVTCSQQQRGTALMRCVRRCFKMLPTMLRPIFSKKSPGKMATLSSSYSYGRVWTGPEQLEDPRPQPTDKRILRVVVLVARAAGAVSLFLFALIALAWWHLFSVDVGDRTAVSGNGRGREKTFTVR